MGEGSNGCCTVLLTFLCGVILYPMSLYWTGLEEQRNVCREKAVLLAGDEALNLDCGSNTVAKTQAGASVELSGGELGFMNCPLDENTFTTYTPESFSGMEGLTGAFSFQATGVIQTVKVDVCAETCAQRTCQAGVDKNGKCLAAEVCVAWSYELRSSLTAPTAQTFHNLEAAKAACGNPPNPFTAPHGGPQIGTKDSHAPAGNVKTTGGKWSMNEFQTSAFPIDTAVTIAATFGVTGFEKSAQQPPASLTPKNTQAVGNALLTCPSNRQAGCMEISYTKAAPARVTVLSKVNPGSSTFANEGWTAPSDWLCPEESINRVCPKGIDLGEALKKGIQSCGQDDYSTMDEMEAAMLKANEQAATFYRCLYCFLCIMAISCQLSPLTAFVEYVEEIIDSVEQVPCVGPIIGPGIDCLTDIVTGMVQCMVCCFSIMCGGASFLIVMALTWIFFRPLYGCALLAVAIVLIVASKFALSQKDGSKRRRRKGARDDVEMGEDLMEEDEDDESPEPED